MFSLVKIVIILILDEIDSVCRARSQQEDEHTRRIKNELLKQLDGVDKRQEKVIILASTNSNFIYKYHSRALGD